MSIFLPFTEILKSRRKILFSTATITFVFSADDVCGCVMKSVELPPYHLCIEGSDEVIGTVFDKSLVEAGCQFCGACVDTCPTGALTERALKYETLPRWRIKDDLSFLWNRVCSGCRFEKWQNIKHSSSK